MHRLFIDILHFAVLKKLLITKSYRALVVFVDKISCEKQFFSNFSGPFSFYLLHIDR